MPSVRRVASAGVFALLAASTVAAARPGPGLGRPDLSPVLQAVGGFVFTLIVGGLVLAISPDYVDNVVGRVREDALGSFLWGVGVLALFIGLVILLVITVVGIIIVIPLALVFLLLAIVGNALGYLALLDGTVDSRWAALAVGAALAGVLSAIPLLGDLIGFVVGSVGLGAMIQVWRS